MKGQPDFVLAVLGASFIAYLLFGGLGLMLVGLIAYFWKLSPYRRGVHAEVSESHHQYFLIQRDAEETLPGPRPAGPYFLQLLLCVGLLVVGFFRLEFPGLLGVAVFC